MQFCFEYVAFLLPSMYSNGNINRFCFHGGVEIHGTRIHILHGRVNLMYVTVTDLTRNGLSLRPSLKSRTNKEYFLFISYGNLL